MISPELTTELQSILREDFNKNLAISEVEKFGNALIGYTNLLIKMNKTEK